MADISAEEWQAMQVTVKTLVENFYAYQEHLVEWATNVAGEFDRLDKAINRSGIADPDGN